MKVFLARADGGISSMFAGHDCYSIVHNMDDADVVVFGGGADINPSLYEEKPLRETSYNGNVDNIDIKQYELALRKKKRMVGICRGAQLLNVMNGGALWQDVDNHRGSHEVIDLVIDEGSKLRVTSTHHQMMIPGSKGVELCIAHMTETYKSAVQRTRPRHDTEVVFYAWQTPTLCVQFHPEYHHQGTYLYFMDLMDRILWES